MPRFKTSNLDEENNEIELRLNFDLLDRRRESKLRYAKQHTSIRSPDITTEV